MKLTLIRDYPKEGWESIEVYANNIVACIRSIPHTKIIIRDYRAFPKIASSLRTQNQFLKFLYRFAFNPLGARFSQGDVNHIVDQSNALMLYLLNREKTIITCHDLIGLWYKLRFKTKAIVYEIEPLKIAKHILCVSQFTKSELITKVGINPDIITVIPESIETFFKPTSESEKNTCMQKYHLPPRYILHVGTVLFHKNILFLLRLFAENLKRQKDIYLVKVGATFDQEQQQLIRRLGIEQRVISLGFVTRKDLPAIYSGASLYIQPSLLEGFGLTVLEAMSCGCPVIVSDIPVFRELFSIGAAFMDTQSLSGSVETVRELLGNIAKRKFLSQLSIRNSKMYSPAHIAKLLSDYYMRI